MKALRFLMCCLISIALTSYYTPAHAATRLIEVVIVIDGSESMNDGPLDAELAAVDKFIDLYNGRIALVLIRNEARLIQNFTSDKRLLKESLWSIKPNMENTNLCEGIELPQSIIETYADPNSDQVVILMSDGIASRGNIYMGSDGRYQLSDYNTPDVLIPRYASAVYNTAQSMSYVTYDIITIHCPPNKNNSKLKGYIELGQDVMNDIATLGCIYAPSWDSLSPIMVDLANTLSDNNDIEILRGRVSFLRDAVKDPSSPTYLFGREYGLPYRIGISDGPAVDLVMFVKWDLDLFDCSTKFQYELAKIVSTLCDNSYGDYDLLLRNLKSLVFSSKYLGREENHWKMLWLI